MRAPSNRTSYILRAAVVESLEQRLFLSGVSTTHLALGEPGFKAPSSTLDVPQLEMGTTQSAISLSLASGAGTAQPAVAPTISSISPNSGSTAGGDTVTILGTNLSFASSVTFGGTAATFSYNTNTGYLQSIAPAHAPGAVNVAVTTPGGTAILTNGYTYIGAPTISSISPNSGSTAGGGTVTILGTNLSFASSVTFGGTTATFSYNVTTGNLQSIAPAHSAGAVNVAVTTPGGIATFTNGYTYLAAPTISSISPNSGSTAGGGTVTILGTNLSFASSVTFGGTAATFSYNTTTGDLQSIAPAHAPGAVNATVTTPGGTATLTNGYTYTGYTLGVDVNNGTEPAWSSIGRSFAFVKATQGNGFTATTWPNYIQDAAKTLTVAPYAFADPVEVNSHDDQTTRVTDPTQSSQVMRDADSEADQFYKVASAYFTSTNLRPMLDLEDDAGNGGFSSAWTTSSAGWLAMASWVNDWTAELQTHVPGIYPILYMTRSYAASLAPFLSQGNYSLWIAIAGQSTQYSSPQNPPPSWDPSGGPDWDPSVWNWTIEQYNTTGSGPSGDWDALNPSISLNSLEIGQGGSAGIPTINDATTVTNAVNPGATLTVNFTVNAPTAENVLLGASLVPVGGGTPISLGAPSAQVSLQTGLNILPPRQYNVVAGTTPIGNYNLLSELWLDTNDDGIIDSGDELLNSNTGINVVAVTPGYFPTVIKNAYGIEQVSFNGTPGDGRGQTIAIVDEGNDPNIWDDIVAFDSAFQLPTPSFQVLDEYGDLIANQADPLASPAPVPTRDPSQPSEIALDVEWAHAIAPAAGIVLVEANSWAESDLESAIQTAAQIPLVSVVSMSFVTGPGHVADYTLPDSCFMTPAGHSPVTFVACSGDNPPPAPIGTPAESPNVLSVGGTSLYINSDGSWKLETIWSNSRGGSGQGISSTEPLPLYQQGTVTASGREVPDVAFDGDPLTGVAIVDEYNESSGWVPDPDAGTSLSAPAWGGLIAIIDQGCANAGLPALTSQETLTELYQLPNSDFHKIGSNPKYDGGTGLGTPIANFLVPGMVGLSTAPASETWTGATSTDWNNSTNWSGGIVPGPATDVVLNGGTVTADSPFAIGSLTLNGATLLLEPSSVAESPLTSSDVVTPVASSDVGQVYTVSSLTLSNGATLDVGNNELIINYGSNPDPISTIAGYLISGRNGGAWNGTGIFSSAAAVSPGYALGYADSADTGNPAGLSSDQIEIKYTLLGDATLTGTVSVADFTILTINLGKTMSGWDQGDFLYTGTITGSDFTALVTNLGKTAQGTAVVLPASDSTNSTLLNAAVPTSSVLNTTAAVSATPVAQGHAITVARSHNRKHR